MKQRQIDSVFLLMSIFCYLMMSVSFLLMSIEALMVLPGIMFWSGLVLGITFQIVLEIRRRAFFKSFGVKLEKVQKPRNGMLSFGSNVAAIVADCFLAVSFVGAIWAFVLTKGYGYICYVFIATTVFSFCLHCILNGRIFFHVKNQLKIRQALEQRKTKSKERGEGRQ